MNHLASGARNDDELIKSSQEDILPNIEEDNNQGKMKQSHILSCDAQRQSQPELDDSSSSMIEEHWPLSDDNPFFDVILAAYHVGANAHLVLPSRIRKLLPESVVPVVLTCRNKSWKMNYLGDSATHKRFDHKGWKAFVVDNKLKEGDGCVFDLSESGPECIKFRVQVLDGELPVELLESVGGESCNTPILID